MLAETTAVPPIDRVLAQQIMSFCKGLAGPVVLSYAHASQDPSNPSITITTPTVGGNVSTDVFFHPLLSSVLSSNENELLTKFLKLKPPVFLGFESADVYEIIVDCYEIVHKSGIVHQRGVEFVNFQLYGKAKKW